MSHSIVLVKQVPDVAHITDDAFDPETGNLVRGRLPSVINELDSQALGVGLALAGRVPLVGGAGLSGGGQVAGEGAVATVSGVAVDGNSPDEGDSARWPLGEGQGHGSEGGQLAGRSKGSWGRVIVLTMGPPQAEAVLRYCLARGADAGVLLSDPALGGADTWATANPLAAAIREIAEQWFDGSDDYYVVTGMQSVDGDTAQVPAQIAEGLGLPCVAYVTDVVPPEGLSSARESADGTEVDGATGVDGWAFRRIISGGSQVVRPRRLPAVVTVAQYAYPPFPTVAGARWAGQVPVIRWGAGDIKATAVGARGSKTRVVRVFPPAKTTRRGERIESVEALAGRMAAVLAGPREFQAGGDEGRGGYRLPWQRQDVWDRRFEITHLEASAFEILARQCREHGIQSVDAVDGLMKAQLLDERGKAHSTAGLERMLEGFRAVEPSYSGPVWVVAECERGGGIHPAAYELVGKGRELADGLGQPLAVVLAGAEVALLAERLIHAGADRVHLLEDAVLSPFDPVVHCRAISELISRDQPQIALFAATPQGRVLAPMVANRVACGLTADCTSLEIRDYSRKGMVGVLAQTRPALGGNIMATIMTIDSFCQMATARPGVFQRLPDDPSRQGEVIREPVNASDAARSLEIISTEQGRGLVHFESEVIVAGGRGLQSRERYQRLIDGLCMTLRDHLKVSVEKGASRAAVESGFVDRIHQVGQTGTAVKPRVYLAIGISGAIQHMIGISHSEVIMAINHDPDAPILRESDYYMVGPVEEVVPALIEALKGVGS